MCRFFVVIGKGTLSFVWEKQRRSYNLKQGDVLRVPAGSIVYLINSDDNEKLHILKLLQPVNTPGKFKVSVLIKTCTTVNFIFYIFRQQIKHYCCIYYV